jgi:hypothetical protein
MVDPNHSEEPRWKHAASLSAVGLAILAILCGVACGGCIGSKSESPEALAHIQPQHWPGDMQRAAEMIDDRLRVLEGTPDSEAVKSELVDLIDWAAEVAADTDLSESDWMPIYQQAESVRKRLNTGGRLVDLRSEINQLSQLLREAHSKVPEMSSPYSAQPSPAADPDPNSPSI